MSNPKFSAEKSRFTRKKVKQIFQSNLSTLFITLSDFSGRLWIFLCFEKCYIFGHDEIVNPFSNLIQWLDMRIGQGILHRPEQIVIGMSYVWWIRCMLQNILAMIYYGVFEAMYGLVLLCNNFTERSLLSTGVFIPIPDWSGLIGVISSPQ